MGHVVAGRARAVAAAALVVALLPAVAACGDDDASAGTPDQPAAGTVTATVTVTEAVTAAGPPALPPAADPDAGILAQVAHGVELVQALSRRSLPACEASACTREVLAGIAGVAAPERRAVVALVRSATEPCAREVGGRFVRLIDAYGRAAASSPGALGPLMRDAGDQLRMLGHLRGACADLIGAGPAG